MSWKLKQGDKLNAQNGERKFRFTASQYHLISKRKRNHSNFAEQLMNPTPVSSKYLEHASYGSKVV